ncbi:MAG TPA: exonuclease SbcCD subunit D [Patescibacteria group bacterium]|nr:exonuclease SbcCD subunit D [Patescibacteria group bacterium]
MRFIHTADIHIGMENYGYLDPVSGLHTRILDFLAAFDRLIDYAIDPKHAIDLVIFSGDAYKTRTPTPTHQREFAKRIMTLTKHKIPVILLVGNHDTPNTEAKANTLDIYPTMNIPQVHVIRKPEVITVQGLQIVGLPWLQRSEFEQIPSILQTLYDSLSPELPAVTCVHASVEGAMFGSERAFTLGKDMVIPLQLLQHPKVSYVALGHIHKRQVLSKTPPVVYSGSIERVDFGEEKEDKSFEVVEINEDRTSTHTPISTQPRPFVSIILNISPTDMNPMDTIMKEILKRNVEQAIVKVKISISPEQAGNIEVGKIRTALDQAFFIAGITKEIFRPERMRLKDLAVKELSPLEMLRAYLKAKNYDESKITQLVKFATKLMEEQ